MSKLSVDELLAQATCAVLIEGQAVGTAWLVSQEGHLLTAGHVLCKDINACDEVYDEVEVQFSDDEPRIARKIKWRFQQEKGIDFAILKLTDMLTNRKLLPILLAKSVELGSSLRLRGCGKTFGDPITGEGKFKGQVDRLGSSGNRLFRYHTQELAEEGFSGGAVYSEQLGAVVAIQIEATNARFGNMSGMVLAMPLYRIAEYWKPLQSFEKKNLSDSRVIPKKLKNNNESMKISQPKREIVNVDIVITTTGSRVVAELPIDSLVGRVLPILVERLGLPRKFDNNWPVEYGLYSKTRGVRFVNHLTFRQNGIQQRETLAFHIDMTAG